GLLGHRAHVHGQSFLLASQRNANAVSRSCHGGGRASQRQICARTRLHAALGVFFSDWETAEYRPRAMAFEQAMEGVAARYLQDDEAQILYALVLDATALPTEKTYANQRKAARILEPLFE